MLFLLLLVTSTFILEGTTEVHCVQLKSDFCPDYNGVWIPRSVSASFDNDVIGKVNTLDHSCNDKSVTGSNAMHCYGEITKYIDLCPDGTDFFSIPLPCRQTCTDYHVYLTSWWQCENTQRNDTLIAFICEDYPTEDCIDGSYRLALPLFLVILLIFVL